MKYINGNSLFGLVIATVGLSLYGYGQFVHGNNKVSIILFCGLFIAGILCFLYYIRNPSKQVNRGVNEK